MLKPQRLNKSLKIIETLRQRWQTLPSRDQWALVLLTVFLLMIFGGYGSVTLRKAATTHVEEYQAAISDYFWLRGQAANIETNVNQNGESQVAELDMMVKKNLQQAGAVSPQVLKIADGVQIGFSHPNQAIASRILGDLTQQGLTIDQLDMRQNEQDKSIQVKATLTR